MGLELPPITPGTSAATMDFKIQAAHGALTGYTPVRVEGANPSLTAGAWEAIWGLSTAYSWGTVAAGHNFISSSANDTVAGTGARTVYIEGLNTNHDVVSESGNLSGTSQVLTANAYIAINRFHVVSVGSGGVNAGNITLRKTSGLVNRAYIIAGEGESNSAIYTVPNNKTGYITQWWAGISDSVKANYVVRTWIQLPSESWRIAIPAQSLQAATADGSYVRFPLDSYIKLPEKTKLYMDGTTTLTGGGISGGYDLILVDD